MSIPVAAGLTLPLDIVTEATAILAKRGAGKSNTAKVVVEGLLERHAQVVVLDPVGHWWGLRSLFPVPVIGGTMGDVPLEPTAGKLLAEVVVESGAAMVLDVSLLDSDGQMQRFVYEFAEQLYKLKQQQPTPLLLVLEEADEFAPQDTRGANVPRMVGSIVRIVKRGRGRGLGMLSITQRSAALSKNVLDQSDTLVVMRTTGPRDRKAIEEWVKHQDAEGMDVVVPSLPGLGTGEAWFWSPQRDLLKRVKVRKARSLDTSASPELGKAAEKPKNLKAVDLEQLGARMAETAERVREQDPARLRERIRELERRAPTAEPVEVEVEVEKLVEVPVFTDEDRTWLHHIAKSIDGVREQLIPAESKLAELTAKAEAATGRRDEVAPPGDRVAPGYPPARRSPRRPRPEPAPAPERRNGDSGLTRPQQGVLDALAWWEAVAVDRPTVGQVAFVVGYHRRSKGFTNNLSALSSAGLIERGPGFLTLTPAGARAAMPPAAPPDDAELQRMIFEQVGPKRSQMLAFLIERGGEAVPVEVLAEAMGYHHRSKGFTNNLSGLSGLGLIERGRGEVRASDLCFVREVAA